MKSIFFSHVFFFLFTNATSGQVISANYDYEKENHDYYFIVHGSDGSQSYPTKEALRKKDILDLFISDSTTFHIRNKKSLQQKPHICQNRFHQFGLVSTENTTQIPFGFDGIIHTPDPGFFIGVKNNLSGLMDSKGKTILPFNYEYCRQVYDMLAMKKKDADASLSFYSIQGKYLFSTAGYFAEEKNFNYISIHDKDDSQKNIIDRKGKSIPSKAGTYIAWILDEYICGYKDRKYGVTTLAGKSIIPFEYVNISPTNDDQFIVYKNGMTGLVDATNKFILPMDSMGIKNFGVLYVLQKYQSANMGLINFKGEQILPANYHIYSPDLSSDAGSFKRSDAKELLFVENIITKNKGVYRADGKQLLPLNNIYLNYQKGKKAIIFKKRSESDSTLFLFGAIDLNGKLIASPSTGRWSFIERSPNVILVVDSSLKNSLINIITGEVFPYERYQFNNYEIQLENDYIVARSNFKYALVSPDGKRLTEPIYSSFYPVTEKEKKLFDEEVVCLSRTKDGLVGISRTGKEIAAKK